MPTFARPLYDPGDAFTGRASGAAVVGGRFLTIAGSKPANGGNVLVRHAGANDLVIGVSQQDAPDAKVLAVYGDGFVLEVTSGGAVTAGSPVKPDAAGKAVTATLGTHFNLGGVALTTVAAADLPLLVKVQL